MKCPKCKYSRAGSTGCDCPMCGTRLGEPLTESPVCVGGFETLCEEAQELAVAALSGELNKRLVTWDNLQEIANWCSAADLYDTRVLLLISSPNGEQMAQVGDIITKHPDGTFSVQNNVFVGFDYSQSCCEDKCIFEGYL